jgi:RHS repeat-associated protein
MALSLLAALTYTMSVPPARLVHLNHAQTAGYITSSNPQAAYQVSETYGGTNPVDTCPGCDFWGHQEVGTSSPPSMQAGNIVNPQTGDVAENYTLFSQPDPGFNFEFNLSYDSLWDQLFTYYEPLVGNTGPNFYGYGWRSNLNTNVGGSGGSGGPQNYTQFAVSLPGGQVEYFYTGACGAGMTSKTAPGSSETFCTADRVDASFSAYNNYGNYALYEHGGRQLLTYNYFGQVVNEGTIQDPSAQTILYQQIPHQSGCPAAIGANAVDVCTVDFDQLGRTYAVGFFGSNNVYDALGVQDPTGQIWPFFYDTSGNLGVVKDPLGNAWGFGYDTGAGAPDQHDLTMVEDPNTNETHLSYTPAGTNGGYVSSVTDATGNQTTYAGYNTYAEDNGETYAVTQANPTGQQVTYQVTANMLQLETVAAANGDTNYSATTEYVYNGTDTAPQEIVTDPMGNVTTTDTDEVGNTLTKTNSYGTTTATYNGFDEACWVAPPGVSVGAGTCTNGPSAGQGATLNYADANGNMIEVIDPTGIAIETQYDVYGNPCWTSTPGTLSFSWPACSSPPAASTRYSYNAGGLLQSESTPDGTGSSFTYDTTTYAYNGYGEVTSTVSPDGNAPGGTPANYTTAYHYDAAGRLYQAVAPMGRTTTATLDWAGNVTSVTDPMNQVTTTAYDPDERTCWTFQGSASAICGSPPTTSTRYTYNANTADPKTVEDPNGHTTTYAYANPDAQDQPTTVTDPLGNITSKVYNKDANLCVSGTGSTSLYAGGDPSCAWTSGYTFDTFDALGNVMSSQDPSGNTTTYARGKAAFPSDVTTVTPPSGGSVQPTNYQYDADGRALQVREGNGTYVSLTYNALGAKCWQAPVNNLSATCATSVPVGGSSWSFTNAGLPATMSDVVSSTQTNATNWTYDPQGQVTQEINNAGTVNYAYDFAGDTTCVSYPVASGSVCTSAASATNTVVNYGFDADGRMTAMSDWLGNSFSFAYDTRSNLTSITYPTSTTWTDTFGPYDAANNLKTLTVSSPTRGTASYSYPVNSNEELSAAGTTSYGYNTQNRVSSAGADSFTYNPNGELKTDTKSGATVTATYDAAAELTGETLGTSSTSFAFDANGNRCATMSGSTTPSCTTPVSGTTVAGYNASNRLCFYGTVGSGVSNPSCAQPPAGTTNYSYDGNGLRTSDTAGPSGNQNFVYDTQTRGGQPLIVKDGTNAYLYGPGNFGSGTAPLEQISLTTGVASYLTNVPSGVASQFAANGASMATMSYSAYGKRTVNGGTLSTPFGFDGAYADPNGLLYMVNRYYDSATGQFLSVDPMSAETGQPYAAFGDNPIDGRDPLGLCNGPDGICINQNTGVMNLNSSPIASDHAPPGTSPFVPIQNWPGPPTPTSSTNNGSLAAFAAAYENWIAEVNAAGAAFKAAEASQQKTDQAVNDYIHWGPGSGGSYSQSCGQAVLVICFEYGETWHLGLGLSFGTPGLSWSSGVVQGSSGDGFLCGWSQTGGIAYGAGVEYGTNPGTTHKAYGFQLATPGFGVNQVYGFINC